MSSRHGTTGSERHRRSVKSEVCQDALFASESCQNVQLVARFEPLFARSEPTGSKRAVCENSPPSHPPPPLFSHIMCLLIYSKEAFDGWLSSLAQALQKCSFATKANMHASFAPFRDTTKVSALVEANDYYKAVCCALDLAASEIFIAGWWVDVGVMLTRVEDRSVTLRSMLTKATERGVQVYVRERGERPHTPLAPTKDSTPRARSATLCSPAPPPSFIHVCGPRSRSLRSQVRVAVQGASGGDAEQLAVLRGAVEVDRAGAGR